jgi:hypothetical protein
MIEASKKYKTRGGRDVRIYAVDGAGGYPVHGAYDLEGAGWQPAAWTADGLFRTGDANGNELDLIEVKPRIKRTVWLNVYAEYVSAAYNSEEMADLAADKDRIARVKVDIDVEEGHGLQ